MCRGQGGPEGWRAGFVHGCSVDLGSPCQVSRDRAAETGRAVCEQRASPQSAGPRQGQQTVSGGTGRGGGAVLRSGQAGTSQYVSLGKKAGADSCCCITLTLSSHSFLHSSLPCGAISAEFEGSERRTFAGSWLWGSITFGITHIPLPH